jgi:dTDP-4-dehydrorhamnose 3,5-epimerase
LKVTPAALPEVLLISPDVFGDSRGFFLETFHHQRYGELGIPPLLQTNLSRSVRGTVRGLHFQEPHPQGKLVQVVRGAIFDVAVDVRRGSPRFGKWASAELSESNQRQLWIPPGFAHGFYVLSDVADILYQCTGVYVPETERCVLWDDPDVGIPWPVVGTPITSEKDRRGFRLKDAPALPAYAP